MISNTLIHREFTGQYRARFVIEKDKMFTENSNRAVNGDTITPENYVPDSKNPLICKFFRNIGYADELGSGVRNLYYYVNRYSGQDPEMIDGDVFKVIVPLDEEFSFEENDYADHDKGSISHDKGSNSHDKGSDPHDKGSDSDNVKSINSVLSETEITILTFLLNNPQATKKEIAVTIGKRRKWTYIVLERLKKNGILSYEGSQKKGCWTVNNNYKTD
jgi:ATP-dependent DNA helicase RecG